MVKYILHGGECLPETATSALKSEEEDLQREMEAFKAIVKVAGESTSREALSACYDTSG